MGTKTVLVIALAAAQAAAGPQERPRQPARASQGYTAATTAILVDVVVRDRRGRPITDLTRDDFEIFENAVPQTIGSFSVVSRATGIGIQVRKRLPGTTTVADSSRPGAAAAEASAAPEEPPTTAMVFDALKPDALSLAQRAALAELPMSGDAPGRIGVFATEPGLRLLQNYTDDLALVRAAVRRVSAAGEGREEAEAARRAQLSDRIRQLDVLSGGVGVDRPAAFGPGNDNSSTAQAIVEAQMANMEMRMLRTFESIDRDHRGMGTASALMTIIQSLTMRAGRKSIVYFSQGLPASPSMQAKLDSVVSAANRANVSVYTIDAAGLRSESTLLETRRELDMAAEERLRQTTLPDVTDGPMMRTVERAEDLLRLDPQAGLARLAEDTGGFLVRDTNDLGSAFRRIEEDNRFHYLLTYSPRDENFDGKFRTIGVKVKRDGAQVFSRKGYFAVRSPSAPVLSYEAPAIAALDRPRPPNAFAIGAAAMVFPDPSGKVLVPIVVRVQTSQLSFQTDPARGTYAAQAAVVARLKDAAGEPVLTLSQQYILTGTENELDAARQGEILFYRQADLPAGIYTLEAIVYDALAEQGSARLSTISVPAASSNRLAASSLVLIRRTETVPPAERAPNLPFYYGGRLLYPHTGEPLRRGADTELMFYIAFYREPASRGTEGTLELLRGGRVLATAPLALSEPSASGRVQHVGTLPIGDLPDGTYELRVRLTQDGDEQARTAFFTIAPAG
jgi:VWFA-related protein